ncbi:MAG: response regulator [bacterium]|nr:response regulator [bacterium]
MEDEIIILSMGKRLLEEKGFQVLTASTPDEALQIVQSHNGAIHLMIADIVMPGMNGFELADHIKALKPNLKIMFISGYEADTIATYGILEDGMPFLHKPFSSDELEAKVQTALRG